MSQKLVYVNKDDQQGVSDYVEDFDCKKWLVSVEMFNVDNGTQGFNIMQRNDGKFLAQFDLGNEDTSGITKKLSKTFNTEQEAIEYAKNEMIKQARKQIKFDKEWSKEKTERRKKK